MQKLIIAIVSNEDSTAASRALTKGGFSVTRLATTGGFLLSGNTTMLVGTDAERVDEAIHIIGENSCKRNKMVSGNTSFNAGMYAGVPVQVAAKRADVPGGSTLGNLLGHQILIPMVDIGLAQLAMHSAMETASCKDAEYMAKAVAEFYNTPISQPVDGEWKLGL